MALITLTNRYGTLNNWVSDLLHASDGVTIGTHDATTFSYTFLAGTAFAGYTVTSLGTGFAFDGTTPIAGTMTGLTIKDDQGQVVLTVSNIVAGSLASDFALFANNEFGWTDWNGGVWEGHDTNAWSQLLSGDDTIIGTSDRDRPGFFGVDAGNDVYNMGAGDDQVNGGMGNDTIHGGAGWDTLDYGVTHLSEGIPMVRGATINLDRGTVRDPYGFTDRFVGIEEFHGTSTADRFIGGALGANFMGLRGADTLIGGTGGDDWVLYQDDAWLGGARGIVARLGTGTNAGGNITGTIRDGFGNLDRTVNIQNVAGTRHDDRFIGNSLGNMFNGGEGTDNYNGGGGDDNVVFEFGFSDAVQHGIKVNLKLASGQIVDDGFGNTENALSIEGVIGSNHDDRIIGSAGNNWTRGAEGNDTLTGAGGHDTFQWLSFSDLGGNDVITDFHAGSGANQDVFHLNTTAWGGTSILHLVHGTAATDAVDTFVFNATNHTLYYDLDGNGSDLAIKVARLIGVAELTAANFDLI